MKNILNRLTEKYNPEIRGVIHIGAHTGQEYPTYINRGIENIIMVEPQPDIFAVLQSNLNDDRNTLLFNLALGAENRTITINSDSTNKGASASVLKPKLHLEQYPGIIFDRTIDAEQRKLDDLHFYRPNYNLIVIDVQGYELEVLKGSAATLEKIDYIISEVNRQELYENCCLVEDLDNYLSSFAFTRVETEWSGTSWGDALYIKNHLAGQAPKNEFRGIPLPAEFIQTEILKPGLDYRYYDNLKTIDPVKLIVNESNYPFSLKPASETASPKLSVIIESFNENNYLEECLESIFGQNYPNLECIFLDVGNIENSAKVLKKYEGSVIYKPVNDFANWPGLLNEALQSATGEIMTRINSDDKYNENAFKIISTLFYNFENVDWLTSRPAGIAGSEEIIEDLQLWSRWSFLAKADNTQYLHKEGTFWRRSLWEKTGGSLNTSLSNASDYELAARFFRYSRLYTVNKILAFRRYKQFKKSRPARLLPANYLKYAGKSAEYEKLLFTNSEKLPPKPIQVNEKGILLFNGYRGNNPDTLMKTAEILWENDQNVKAKVYLEKALNLDPDSEELITMVSELNFSLGFKIKAREICRAFLKRFPANEKVRNLLFQKFMPASAGQDGPYLITAIVMLKDNENLLAGCINDLLGQTIADRLEIIFVDCNPGQEVEKIIKNFPEQQIIYLKKAENETESAAFNRVINLASGKFITKVRAGNRHREDAFAVIAAEIESGPETEVIFSNVYISKAANSRFRIMSGVTVSQAPKDFISFLKAPDIISIIHTTWKKTLHEQYGFYDQADLKMAESEFIIRILQTSCFKIIKQVLGYYLFSPAYPEHSTNFNEIKENNQLLKIYLEAYDKGEIIKLKTKLLKL
jgi:FkbM family methyltransferase